MAKPGMTKSERKWNTYYQPIIQQYKLAEQQAPGYPHPVMSFPSAP